MKNCRTCIHHDMCVTVEIAENKEELNEYYCDDYKNKHQTIELPCLIGDTVYKICPKCDDDHNGSCKHCAWAGCSVTGCDVGVWIYSDGSHNEHPLQLVPVKVYANNLCNTLEYWNIMFFETKELAEIAMYQYDEIRKTENREERVEKFKAWVEARDAKISLEREKTEK